MFTIIRRNPLRRRFDASLSSLGLTGCLRLLWALSVLWFELGSFLATVPRCSWPDANLASGSEKPGHVLLVADTQVRTLSAARRAGRSVLRQLLIDLSLRKNWHHAARLRPDAVVFMGDTLASWRHMQSEEEYLNTLAKFLDIFSLDPKIDKFYLPGNNDVGLNIDPAAARIARGRFTKHFGPLNRRVDYHNHTLILLDASGLVEEDYQRAANRRAYADWTALPHGPVEFLRSLQHEAEERPTILFTHIPLHRPEAASCGPHNRGGRIVRSVGLGYQSAFGKKTTAFLLQTAKPNIIFSADHRDYCDYTHIPPQHPLATNSNPLSDSPHAEPADIREITLQTFSPTDVHYTGFQLLSLGSSMPTSGNDAPTFAQAPCFLPDYTGAYAHRYLPLFLSTLVLVTFSRWRARRPHALPLTLRDRAQSIADAVFPFSPVWSPFTPGFGQNPTRSPMASPQGRLPAVRTPAPDAEGTSMLRAASTRGESPLLSASFATIPLDDDWQSPVAARRLPSTAAGTKAEEDEVDEEREKLRGWSWPGIKKADADEEPKEVVSDGRRIGTLSARRARRVVARRVGRDMLYVMWPAVVIWVGLAWWVS